MCKTCESTIRYIWPPSDKIPEMGIVAKGNWILLRSCPECNSLWVESPYEPYASFRYLVRWKYTKEIWIYLNNIDDSKKLLAWHKQEIKKNWKGLSRKDQKLIEKHRERAYYQYDPIDLPATEKIDIDKYINEYKNER
jgi:hypothetical protein